MFLTNSLHKAALAGICLVASLPLVPAQQRVALQPGQAATIVTPGVQSAIASTGVPAGTIVAFGGAVAPAGYLMCDGTEVLRDDYPRLFASIGTAWGAQTGFTFTVPDLRGRFLRGVDEGAGLDPDRLTRTPINVGGNGGDQVGSAENDGRKGFSGTFSGTTATAGAHTHDIVTRQGDWDEDDGCSSCHDPAWADDEFSPNGSPGNWKDTESAGAHSHNFSVNVSFSGEAESRPKNANVNFIIKI